MVHCLYPKDVAQYIIECLLVVHARNCDCHFDSMLRFDINQPHDDSYRHYWINALKSYTKKYDHCIACYIHPHVTHYMDMPWIFNIQQRDDDKMLVWKNDQYALFFCKYTRYLTPMKSIYKLDLERYLMLRGMPLYDDCLGLVADLLLRVIKTQCYCKKTDVLLRKRDQYLCKRIQMAIKHNKTLTPSILQCTSLNSEVGMMCTMHCTPRIILVGCLLRQYEFDGRIWREVTGCCCKFNVSLRSRQRVSPWVYLTSITQYYTDKALCGTCAGVDFITIGNTSEYAIVSTEPGKWRIMFN